MSGIIKGTSKFFHNIVTETKKITWPTGKELLRYTITVVITVVFLAIFFVLVDLGITQLLHLITQ